MMAYVDLKLDFKEIYCIFSGTTRAMGQTLILISEETAYKPHREQMQQNCHRRTPHPVVRCI